MPLITASDYSETFVEEVDPESMKGLAAHISRHTGFEGFEKSCFTAKSLEFVKGVGRDESLPSGFNRSPVETVREGGKCVDLSVLLASILKVEDVKCRMVIIPRKHQLVEVGFSDPGRVGSDLNGFYMKDNQYFFEKDNESYWFVADPSMSDFVGDISGLKKNSFVKVSGGDWNWSCDVEFDRI